MQRLSWIVFGAVAQAVFGFTVPCLWLWLYRGGGDLLGLESRAWAGSSSPASLAIAVLIDLVLLLQFGLWHSLLLAPGVRRLLERWLPGQLYGSFYTLCASLSLLLTFWLWQPLPGVIFATTGAAAWLLLGLWLASWGLLIYSMSLTGLGWQTGMTPWWAYVCQQSVPRRPLVTGNLYSWLRHPIYFSFLALIWLTPRMTTDHLLIALVWTGYIFVGSVYKDRRLLFFLGERYLDYMRRVPGYPLMMWGPLARQRPAPKSQA